ncbi:MULTISPECIES: C40 family peptidase [unclassified Nocardioides]|uniref:C40 family peptidase n=1 Tax=unclassified Nocardioides TaxID=2615069 RepID=UPI000A43C887|nr:MULTISPECIES: C40 family peptidase [unclassified Nocardioides]
MRTPTLGTGLLALVLTAGVVAPAIADSDGADGTGRPGKPSVAEVREAREDAAAAKSDVDRVRERLAAADAALDAASIRAAKAAEAWNGARWQAQQARRAERVAAAASARSDRALAEQKESYRDVVLTTHNMGIDLNIATSMIAADGMESLLEQTATNDRVRALLEQQRQDYDAAADLAADAEQAATDAAAEADRTLAAARTARDAAQAEAGAAAATARQVGQQKVRLVRTLARLEGVSVAVAQRRQDALAQEQRAAREAAVRRKPASKPAQQPAQQHADKPDKPDPQADPQPAPTPAPAGGAWAAVAFARAQLGERYVWGAAGPDTWDCSGLTSKAWAAGGKSLPHYSVAQYDVTTPISASELRPGDLVFWGDSDSPSSIFHVALYVGDGRIVHAPRTGRPVTEESMYYWRTPDFYGRP